MNMIRIFRTLGPVDMKNVRRDALLLWVPLLPLLLGLGLRFGAPPLAAYLAREADFDLTTLYPLLMGGFLMTTPIVVGMVIGFLLLDERDDQTLTALLVTPLPVTSYLAYRLLAPAVVGFIMSLVAFPIAGLVSLPLGELIAIAAVGALVAPMMALFLAAFAENKVAGFALVKFANVIIMVPSIAYFVQSDWQVLAGVVPTYWAMKALWVALDGGSVWPFLAAGVVVNVVELWLLVRRFRAVLYR